jgi:hypothetical protein
MNDNSTFGRGVARVLVMGTLPAVALVTALACGDSTGPKGPRGPGEFQVDLVSPFGAEGSAIFEIMGGTGLGEVVAANGEAYFHRAGGSLKVIVLLDAPGAIRFRVETDEVGDVPSVTVVQVADGDDELRASVSGYQAEVVQREAPTAGGEGGAP